jgi:hypothetical protein
VKVVAPDGVSADSALALAKPVGFRPLSIATVGLHMAHTVSPRTVDPSSKDLKPAGHAGIMVSNPSAETYARKLAQQIEWDGGSEQGQQLR